MTPNQQQYDPATRNRRNRIVAIILAIIAAAGYFGIQARWGGGH